MHEMFTRDGRELSLDTVIYDRSKKKGQTMIDTIDRGCLEGGCLAHHLRAPSGEKTARTGNIKGSSSVLIKLTPPAITAKDR